MNIEKYQSYCLSKKGVTASFPFPKLTNILVFKVMEKMFTATDIDSFQSISVKANPAEIEDLRARFSCLAEQPYMSKKHWNKVILDNSVEDSLIYKWIDTSYELVIQNLTKKQQQLLKTL